MKPDVPDNAPPVRLWYQFTLRTLFLVTSLVAVVLSAIVTQSGFFNGVLVFAGVGGLLGAMMGTATAGRIGAWRGMVIGIPLGVVMATVFEYRRHAPLPQWWNCLMRGEGTIVSALLLMLPMAFLVHRVVKRTPKNADADAALRTVARLSLLLLVFIVPVAFWEGYLQQLGHSNRQSDQVFLVTLLGVSVMGCVVLQWLVLDRRRAAGASGRPYGRWDTAAKLLLGIGAVGGPASFGVAVLLLFTPAGHGAFARMAQDILAGLIFAIGQGIAGCCLATGFAIETYRDRWCLPSTIVGDLPFLGLWLLAITGHLP